jgi:CheY-like chemotaxis protein
MTDKTGRRFLVGDYDKSLAEIIFATLKYAAQVDVVEFVANADEALAMLKSTRFDFLITDHRTPGMQGTSLIREARQIDPSIQVILITAYADILLKKEISELGGIGLVTMPFEVDDILRALTP